LEFLNDYIIIKKLIFIVKIIIYLINLIINRNMALKKKYAYCNTCGKSIPKPKKKPLESIHYQIILVASLATFCIALVVFIIYRKFIQNRKYCPKCNKEIVYYDSPNKIPGPKVPVINLLEKLEDKKDNKKDEVVSEIKREFMICENCEKEIEKEATICPYCGWKHEIPT